MRWRFWTKQGIDPSRALDCKSAARVLQSYLDGELDGLSTSRVREHLEVCRACGLEADTYSAIKDSIGSGHSPSDDAVRRLEQFAADLMQGDNKPS